MIHLEFIYSGVHTNIQCNIDDSIKEIFQDYTNKIEQNINNLYFLCGGKKINKELTFKDIAFPNDDKKIMILVYEINNISENSSLIKSKEIICPICKESSCILIKDYKINLFGCKNGHCINNLLMNEFEKSQYIDISQIKCNICSEKNKSTTFNNEFYICLTCKLNLCPLCLSIHNKNHNIINYERKNYICEIHNEGFISYCQTCKKNLCFLCETETHEGQGHEIILLKKLVKRKNSLIDELNNKKSKIDKIKNEKIILTDILNEKIKFMEKYYNLYKDIIANFNLANRNYQILFNLDDFFKTDIFEDLDNIISSKNIEKNDDHLFNEVKMDKDILVIKYNIDKSQDKIDIFGSRFVENNSNNFTLILKNREYELKNKIILKDYNKDILEINLKINNNNFTDISYMFYNCLCLSDSTDFSNWNVSHVQNMSYMFANCKSIKNLLGLKKWDTSNVTDFSYMFHNCESLADLNAISNWKINNKASMHYMFLNCKSLILNNLNMKNLNKINFINQIEENKKTKKKININKECHNKLNEYYANNI